MRILVISLCLCLSPNIFANTITTQVYDIDYGRNAGEETLLLLKSGHVAKIPSSNKGLINEILLEKEPNQWFTFTLDKERYITEVKRTQTPEYSLEESPFTDMFNKNTYVPTTVASMEVAQRYHRQGRRNPKDSQCFNRALVWSYEWWRNNSVRSMKLFIFFTRTYIRRYNFEWWFHIAPYLHVMEDGKVTEKVMDLKYTRGPIAFRRWTNIFMRNDAECMVITKYSDYANYPYTGECYLYRTNMYTYQPADLEMNEAWQYTKTSFNMDEVKGAYLEAFDVRL